MPTGLQLVQAPAGEPVSLAEAKQWLRVDADDATQDDTILLLVRAARGHVEGAYDRQLVSATWAATVDRFPRYSSSAVWQYNSDAIWQQRLPVTQLSGQWYPDRASIRFPRPPLQAVTSITYVDGAGALQTVDPSVYNADTTTEPGRCAPAYGQIWPIVRQQLASVKATFVAGYGPRTTLPGGVSAGTQEVTPASMYAIYPGTVLRVDTGTGGERVAVQAVTATTFTATFGQAHPAGVPVAPAVPEPVLLALRLLVAHWWEHREAVSSVGERVALAVDSLLWGEWSGEYK